MYRHTARKIEGVVKHNTVLPADVDSFLAIDERPGFINHERVVTDEV